ncbi:zinc ribbon domain-containing protein [Natrinema altunense]|uniref:Transposase, IS605 OrfB family protein n=1 Tax=Natrinema altunense (strain JCM 12890 / CGMCC 1.3731 / AJ2) TaxID=1227494 RepID=L9ZKN8_NATA2|nr:zinc ribbon domain-containing protein [Natrinema altunense]ELY85753.1 transposase, IS605 OrfB family protein [Natrinema altunense JCM 12890]
MSDDTSRGLESPDTRDASLQSASTDGPRTDREETPIGVDIGEYNLYTACPIDLPDWRGAHAVCGDALCQRLDDFRREAAALLASTYDRPTIAAYVQQRRDALVAALDAGARTVCEYATAYDDPVLVTEDSHYSPDLWAWLTAPNAHRGSAWLLAAAHLRLRTVAAEYRLPVSAVPEAYSTQECHACGVLGTRELNRTVRCTNPDCRVDTVAADFNAAAVLARRYYPGRCCACRGHEPPTPGHRPPVAADGGPLE